MKWISVYYRITKKSDPKVKELGLTSVDFTAAKDQPAEVLIVVLRMVMQVYDMAAQMLGWDLEKYKEELKKFQKEVAELSIGENE